MHDVQGEERLIEQGQSARAVEEFDYVIVGAGSAGAVIAARLSEQADVEVALVEAGGSHKSEIFDVPSRWPDQQLTASDWDLDTEPEPGLAGRRLGLSRGKVLGGSSSMNGMIYLRGAREDYDGWRNSGLLGWGAEEVLPTFTKMETRRGAASDRHGGDGPIVVEEAAQPHEVSAAWVEAAMSAGYPRNDDLNGDTQFGAGFFPLSIDGSRRVSSATAYLEPAEDRRNLTVLTHTRAMRVVIEHGRAVGVEVEHLGERRVLRARREVVVSAGTYLTPQLLMLSGIGHAEHLRSLGIDVVQDLPVGDNLQDHPGVGLYYFSTTGPAEAGSALGEAGGFFAAEGGATPDTETMVYPYYNGPQNTISDRAGAGFTITVQVLRPHSRGSVRLRSSHPTAAPLIQHNHFTDERDRKLIADAIRLNLAIIREPAMQRLIVRPRLLPESESDADILAYVRAYGHGFWHPTSTAPMGAVLDERLRVRGVPGLRVADASAMPTIVGANPNATVFMIGEKAAAFITEDARGTDLT
ncbi:GMC family oxidoreductase N-terminal domain-containing protein [Microbacterium sp. NPDC028030]|uniref:GMC family oxidoreductase n=1 Tax=Microbacterium sp. NPDC028030 TaxID=3155124 RepID=UPI0033EB13D8